ncbi:MAG: hypothetical protein IPM13_17870 [Phycisphaerales bacterium]|nr:hypothetical protein [Phycisphaerales bacterium]
MARATVSQGRRTAKSGGKAPTVSQKRGKPAKAKKPTSPKTGSPKTDAPKNTRPKATRPVPAADPAVVDDRPRLRAAPPPIDHDIDPAVLEFIAAIESYRLANARPFPSWSEVLHVLRQLGYRKA